MICKSTAEKPALAPVYAQTITCTPIQEWEMTRLELCTDIVRRRAVGTGKGQGRAEVADQIMP